jgi:predicted nucleic acid-binding protein
MASKKNREVFADTSYWIALVNPGDPFHGAAVGLAPRIKGAIIVTSDWVLNELLTFFTNKGEILKRKALEIYGEIMENPNIFVEPASRNSFVDAVNKYRSEPTRRYSIVDCTSFVIMRAHGIQDALSADTDFEREGFTKLIR